MKPEPEDGIDWEATTWEGSRRRQLEYWARMSLDEILAAQEEMADLADGARADAHGDSENKVVANNGVCGISSGHGDTCGRPTSKPC